jgi:hypothetical protein
VFTLATIMPVRRRGRVPADHTRCRIAARRAAISDFVSRSSNPLSATFFAALPTSRHAQHRVDLIIAGGA